MVKSIKYLFWKLKGYARKYMSNYTHQQGKTMTKDECIFRILYECDQQGITNKDQIRYILATVEHETNDTFAPVREAYWLSESWRKKNLRYYPYYGRGFVQITWEENYKKFGDIIGIDLVSNPDLALDIDNAVFILVYGMKHGSFTGKKLSDYINEDKTDYVRARRIINGKDRASHIARLALQTTVN